MNKIKFVECEIYEKYINIQLYNNIVSFIAETTNNRDKKDILSKIKKKCIWFEVIESPDIQEYYQFEYLGELLERFEERMGKNIKDIRAIALAVGYAKELIEDNMIIGTQMIDFINRVKKLSLNDIYLQGALYLYDNKKYNDYGEHLLHNNYCKTEDIMFMLSVFYDRLESIFNQKKTEIIKLLGKEKTILPIGNIKIYAWIIRNLYPIINKSRKKDISLLKALINLPTGYQKEDSVVFKEMINNNYNNEEIAYMNYSILYYNTVPKAVQLGYSMLEEKIVINLCKVLINSKKEHSEDIYSLIKELLRKYNKFKIKCYGFYGINQALENEINVVNPITFIKLYEILKKKICSFNILESKWDIIAKEFSSKQYEELFDNFLLNRKLDKRNIYECIKKYNKIKDTNYLDTFLMEHKYQRNLIFAFLVDNEIIKLEELLEKNINNDEYKKNEYIEYYISEIRNRKSFELLKYLTSQNKYSIKQIDNFGFKLRQLYKLYSYNTDIDVLRDFLDEKEERFLFDCVEKYVFYVIPEEYIEFLNRLLKSKIAELLISNKDLREIYLMVCDMSSSISENQYLQEKYLTSEEINERRERERKEKIIKEEQKRKEILRQLNEEFEQIPKNTMQDLYRFVDRYYFDSEKRNLSYNLIKEYMLININNFGKELEDIRYFTKILEFGIDKKIITSKDYIKIIYEYFKEEVKLYGITDGTC